MERTEQDIKYLFSRYCNQLSTREEYEHFLALVEAGEQDVKLKSLLTELWAELEAQHISESEIAPKRFKLWRMISAAAAIILIASVGLLFFNRQFADSGKAPLLSQSRHNDIAPGGNRAYLTLNNGKKISLTNVANGLIASQSGVKITKTADGQLIYTVADGQTDFEGDGYNTIETPMGGQYQLHLPDGTKVWLNAASSLKYPASFSGRGSRRVELEGEAYFEVAKDKSRSFIVHSALQDVEVLGTHFNISAYKNDPVISTTLLEGSVRIKGADQGLTALLKPGQQSGMTSRGLDIKAVDVAEAVAWKNGLFVFGNDTIEGIMRRVARWYNVDIRYEGDKTKEIFVGTVSRYENVSELLKNLELTDQVHFKIEGRRITVMP